MKVGPIESGARGLAGDTPSASEKRVGGEKGREERWGLEESSSADLCRLLESEPDRTSRTPQTTSLNFDTLPYLSSNYRVLLL